MKSPVSFVIVSPDTVKFSTFTEPVPLALKSKSAFVLLDVITLLVILTLSICASLAKIVFHLFVAEPIL